MTRKSPIKTSIRDRLRIPSTRVLIIASDNVNIWGVVVAAKRQQLSLLARAFHPLLNESHGVQALLDALRSQLKQNKAGPLPQNAHLVCTDALSMLVDMPADHSQQQDHDTLRNVFRWELEPAMIQRQSLWTLGNVLIAHRWLKRSQLHQLIDMQAQRRIEDGKASPLGNMVLDEGYIAEPQLETALLFQQNMREESTDLDCAWIEVPASETTREFADAPKKADENRDTRHWLACAISTSRQDFWQREFLKAEISLDSIHPLFGANPSLPGADELVLLDLHNGAVCCSRYTGGVLSSLQVDYGFDHDGLTQCQSLLEEIINVSGKAAIELRGSLENIADCGAALAKRLQLSLAISRCDVIEADKLDYIEHARYGSLTALAGQFLKLKGVPKTLFISTSKPRIPRRQRIGFWWAAAAVLIAGFVTGMEAFYGLQLHDVARRYETTKTELEKKEHTVELLETENSREQSLTEEEKKLQQEFAALQQQHVLLEKRIPQRQVFIARLLPMLGQAAPQELVLDRVNESAQGLQVSGWALDDVTAQKLISELSGPLADYQLQLSETQITPQTGPLGHDGQQFIFHIVARPLVVAASRQR